MSPLHDARDHRQFAQRDVEPGDSAGPIDRAVGPQRQLARGVGLPYTRFGYQ
jgi:hypothetical protein